MPIPANEHRNQLLFVSFNGHHVCPCMVTSPAASSYVIYQSKQSNSWFQGTACFLVTFLAASIRKSNKLQPQCGPMDPEHAQISGCLRDKCLQCKQRQTVQKQLRCIHCYFLNTGFGFCQSQQQSPVTLKQRIRGRSPE